MPKVSGSGAGVATTLTKEAQLMVASTGEQTEEGTSGAPVVGVAWLGVAMMSQVEAAQPHGWLPPWWGGWRRTHSRRPWRTWRGWVRLRHHRRRRRN